MKIKLDAVTAPKKKLMFDQLPPPIQAQIKRLLQMNDFRAAKALYDKFLKSAVQ